MSLSIAKSVSLTASPVKRKVVQSTTLTSIARDNNDDSGDTNEEYFISEKALKESLPPITDFFMILEDKIYYTCIK